MTLFRRITVALVLLWLPAPAAAQLRPVAATTLRTTDTSANSLVVGGATGATTGTGGIKAGPVVASQLTVNSVGIIGTDGRIPAISTTYFASLSGANLTGIAETSITDGAILARVAANETISGSWTFSGVSYNSTTPAISFDETDATADEGHWQFIANGDAFTFRTFDDANVAQGAIFTVARTGATVDSLTVGATQAIFASGGTSRWVINASAIAPFADDSYTIGTTSLGVKKFYADRTSTDTDNPQYAFSDDPDTGFGSIVDGTAYITSDGNTIATLHYGGADAIQLFGQTDVYASAMTPLKVVRQADDGTLISLIQDASEEGSISVSGTTVAYNTFMGAHYTQLMLGQAAPEVGTVVVSTGKQIPVKPRKLTRATDNAGVLEDVSDSPGDAEDGADRFVYVEPSTRRNQKGVYGIWHADLGRTAAGMSWGDPDAEVYQVAGLGLGPGVWVTDTCGPIANGDWLATSPIEGLAERQCTVGRGGKPGYDPVNRDYTLGKALTDVDFSKVEPDVDGVRKVRIPLIIVAG